MFTTLFTYPAVQTRHLSAPFAASREQFLIHCAQQGYRRSSLKKIAWILLVLSKDSDFCNSTRVTLQQIELAVDHRDSIVQRKKRTGPASSRQMFIHITTDWLRFRGVLVEPRPPQHVSTDYIEQFARFMREERGLSPITITHRCQQLSLFLQDQFRSGRLLSALSIQDVDTYLSGQGKKGWSRQSLAVLASTLRTFFCYAEGQGWVSAIAQSIDAPRIFSQESLPLGLTRKQVQQLIASTENSNVTDIRNHAIILLLAVYGFRRSEVACLQLEDINWDAELLRVTRPKQRCSQQYPLETSVGNAILHYLTHARPKCVYRELFLSLHAPIRPLSSSSISAIIRSRLNAIGISRARLGAHCLRHACAQRLLDEGFSLKQIGDQLGHRSAANTLHYLKIDFKGLRKVAELDLGGVL